MPLCNAFTYLARPDVISTWAELAVNHFGSDCGNTLLIPHSTIKQYSRSRLRVK